MCPVPLNAARWTCKDIIHAAPKSRQLYPALMDQRTRGRTLVVLALVLEAGENPAARRLHERQRDREDLATRCVG